MGIVQKQVIDQTTDGASGQALRHAWHLITSEYPPQHGGVSDYTQAVAAGLADQGDEVHVWCPALTTAEPVETGVTVHRQFTGFSPVDLQLVGRQLDGFPAPRRILVQWVPHGYGYHSMNVPFCWWLWNRARVHGDQIELMVHEPYLSFRLGSVRQSGAATVHRLMASILLRAAHRVWISIPGWEPLLRPYAFGRKLPFQWLPIPSNVPIAADANEVQMVRRRYAKDGQVLIGHFGTFGSLITELLEPILSALARQQADQVVLLIGQRSQQFRDELLRKDDRMTGFLQATGRLTSDQLSHHLSACDLLIQPYPDGASTRRTSLMAGLSHGKPIVTTRGHLTEPFWSRTDAAVLVPAGNAPAFVECVTRLREDATQRKTMGCAARKLYQKRFDICHTISALRRPGSTQEPEQ